MSEISISGEDAAILVSCLRVDATLDAVCALVLDTFSPEQQERLQEKTLLLCQEDLEDLITKTHSIVYRIISCAVGSDEE